MMSINLSDIAILNITGSDYHCIISLVSKNEAVNLLQNVDLTEKVEHYKKVENYIIFFLKQVQKQKKAIMKFGEIEIKKQKFH